MTTVMGDGENHASGHKQKVSIMIGLFHEPNRDYSANPKPPPLDQPDDHRLPAGVGSNRSFVLPQANSIFHLLPAHAW